MKPEEFFKKYEYDFILATVGTSIFPSVKAAQAALETGYGKSPTKGKNLFGIKAKGAHTPYWTGAQTTEPTREVINGESIIINDGFRSYATVSDSIKDHTQFLLTNSRYAKVFTATTPEQQCKELQAAGYATDPGYSAALINIINKYDLKELDKKKRP